MLSLTVFRYSAATSSFNRSPWSKKVYIRWLSERLQAWALKRPCFYAISLQYFDDACFCACPKYSQQEQALSCSPAASTHSTIHRGFPGGSQMTIPPILKTPLCGRSDRFSPMSTALQSGAETSQAVAQTRCWQTPVWYCRFAGRGRKRYARFPRASVEDGTITKCKLLHAVPRQSITSSTGVPKISQLKRIGLAQRLQTRFQVLSVHLINSLGRTRPCVQERAIPSREPTKLFVCFSLCSSEKEKSWSGSLAMSLASFVRGKTSFFAVRCHSVFSANS